MYAQLPMSRFVQLIWGGGVNNSNRNFTMIPPSARIQFEKHKSASGVWNGIRV
jgi:hypothetical protein